MIYKRLYKIVSFTLVLSMMVSTMALAFAAEIVASGTCGDNLTWVLDNDGTLTISGQGDIPDYPSANPPWFFHQGSIDNVIIEDGVTSIGYFAFVFCAGIDNVSIGRDVKYIDEWAFYECNSLKKINVSEENTSYCSVDGILYSKDMTTLLKAPCQKTYNTFSIPGGVTSIGAGAFSNCTNLMGVNIPVSVTDIGDEAFLYCTRLTNVIIPDSVTAIGSSAFKSCRSLTNVVIGNSVTTIGSAAFMYCSNLTNVSIPNSVTSIGTSAFNDCGLTSVTIPYGVTDIGSAAFMYCNNLTSVTIADSVAHIGGEAFYACYELTDVYFLGTEVDWEAINIGNSNECLTGATIHFLLDDNIEGIFKYAGVIDEEKDTVSEYFYSDGYFCSDAAIYNPSLATMSVCLEMSSWSSHEHGEEWSSKKAINVEHLLTGCAGDDCIDDPGLGFTDFARNDFWNEIPTKHSIGVVAAQKQIVDDGEDYTLIAVVVRGGGYYSEWGGNFVIGNSGNHVGFDVAKEEALSFLKSYIGKYVVDTDSTSPKNLKLWIVGFSRGGAVANMVAGSINNNPLLADSKYINPVEKEDLFCYTFEAPQGVHESTKTGSHENIHNVINLNDLVPLVAPFAWGFSRYGYPDFNLPSADTSDFFSDQNEAMKAELEKMGFDLKEDLEFDPEKDKCIISEDGYTYEVIISIMQAGTTSFPVFSLGEKTSSTPTNTILNNSVDLIANNLIAGRENYYNNIEWTLSEVLGIVNHYSGVGGGLENKFENYLSAEEFITRLLTVFEFENFTEILSPMASVNPFYSLEERLDDVSVNLSNHLRSVFKDSEELKDFEGIENLIEEVGDILWRFCEQVAIDIFHGNLDTLELTMQFADVLIRNGFKAHYPEISLAWLRSQDPNYNDNIFPMSGSSTTRELHINCPVDVYVCNENGILLSYIESDISGNDNGSAIISGINENGEKVFYLPGDSDYRVYIIATDNGTVSVSLGEYDYRYGGITRLVNYYDIPVETGDELQMVIPAITEEELVNSTAEGSTTDYQLLDTSSSIRSSDEDFSGMEQADVKHDITLISDGNGGRAYGAGSFNHGSYAEIEAQTFPSAEFLGWYVNDELVSTDTVYRFAVREDLEIVAKFSTVEFHPLTYGTATGGSITSVEGYYPEGVNIAIAAVADEGYTFDHWSSDSGSFTDANSAETTFVMPDSDVVITANFKQDGVETQTYSVTFDCNGGAFDTDGVTTTMTENITVNEDGTATIDLPAAPVRDGYSFDGWYTDAIGGTKLDGDTVTVTSDSTFYAHWIENHKHTYAEPIFNWSEDYSVCTATFVCIDSDDTKTINCTVTSQTTPATESEDGATVYTANVEFAGQNYTDIQIVVIPATGTSDPSVPIEPVKPAQPLWWQLIENWLGHMCKPEKPAPPSYSGSWLSKLWGWFLPWK